MLLGEQRLLKWYLGVSICVVAGLYFWLFMRPGGDPSFGSEEVRRWSPSSGDIQKQRSQDLHLLAGFSISDQERGFVSDMESFHRYEGGLEEPRSRQGYADRSHEYRLRVERFIKLHGMDRYNLLGLSLRSQFVGALTEFLGPDSKGRAVRAAGEDARLVELSGDFLQWSRQVGLIPDSDFPGDEALFLTETLFKFRWLRWAERLSPMDAHISRFEKSVVVAFQVQRYQGLTLERRLELIHELSALVPDYPVDQVYIETLIKAGKFEEARAYLFKRRLEDPDSGELMRIEKMLFGDARE